MDQIVIIALLVLGVPLAVGIWLIARAIHARDQIEELGRRVDILDRELRQLKAAKATAPKPLEEKLPVFAATTLPPRRDERAPVPPPLPPEKSVQAPFAAKPCLPPQPVATPSPSIDLGSDLSIGPALGGEPVIPELPKPVAKAKMEPPAVTPAGTPVSMPPPPLIPPLPPSPAEPVPVLDAAAREQSRSFQESTPKSARAGSPGNPVPAVEKSLEMRVGTVWLVRVGIVILLTGLALGANLAYHEIIPKLGPAGKISLLYFASALLLGAGAWWQRRSAREALQNYAQVLFAGGLAAVYFTTYAAHYAPPVQVITSPLLDGTLLLVWAGVMAWIADRRKSEIMALFAVGLAFFTSVITRVGEFTLYSNLLLTAAAVVFLVRNRWAGLSFASLVTSYAGYAFWRFLHEDGWRWAQPGEQLWLGAGFLASYWVVFTAAAFLSRSRHLSGASRAAFLTLNNGAYFALFLLTMIEVHTGGFWKFSLGYGSVLLVLSALAGKFLPAEPLTKNSYLTHGLVLVTLGFITKFSGLQLALVLGAESMLLHVMGHQRQSLVLKCFACAAALLATGWCGATSEPMATTDLFKAVGLGAMLAFNAGWALRLEIRANAKTHRLESTFFAVLAFAAWAMAAWFDTAEPHLLVALVFGVESVVFYQVLGGNKIVAPKITAYASAVIAVIWNLENFQRLDHAGLWTGVILGALLIANAWRAHRDAEAQTEPLRPEPAVFTLLALAGWLVTSWGNVTEEHLPLVLAAEAVALTFSIYGLRVREITLLGQSFLGLAQIAWVFHGLTQTPPWWNPLALIAVTVGLSHWWQHQKTLAISRKFYVASSGVFALAAVAVVLVWLHPLVSAPGWLVVTSLLALAVTAYGLATRVWALAMGGQIFLGVSAWGFVTQLLQAQPEWYFPLAPLAVLAAMSFATVAWFGRQPAGAAEVRQPLLQLALVYRWLALALSLLWVGDYVPGRERVWAFMLAATAVFRLAVWRKASEALVAAAVYATVAVGCLWLRDHLTMDVYWPNLLSLLALLAMQQTLRRRPAPLAIEENLHGVLVGVAGLSLWRFLSCWTPGLSGFSITMTWAGYAVAVFVAGILLHERFLRWLGLSVLTAAVGRVILVDLWREEPGARVLTILALGVALLAVGFIYSQFQDKIRKWL